MAPTLKENIDYFRNRVTFEVPVYDKPQFQAIVAKANNYAAYHSIQRLLAETRGKASMAFDLYNFGEQHRLEEIIEKLEEIVELLN